MSRFQNAGRASAADALTRRRLLQTGGTALTFGALVAACGGSSDSAAPGRVGNAPVITPLPQVTVDDAVLLRTATSLEYTAIDVYAAAAELGVLDGRALELVERFVADHQRHADITAELTSQAGSEPYECANTWLLERGVAPLLERITGNEAKDIPPSDDVARDLLGISFAFESVAGATYQQMVELLTDPDLRRQIIVIGAEEARHAAAVAIARTGAPEGYISPALAGAEIDPEANDGIPALYAIPGNFGSVAPVELTIGVKNDAGSRFTTSLQTPADNAFVYEGMTCET
ncbi:MAG: ferritin-like domain-containing protein [Actinomycetota bacterium]|nr:ferritin-like domain-containing protein [Actinomycetota bacterium]